MFKYINKSDFDVKVSIAQNSDRESSAFTVFFTKALNLFSKVLEGLIYNLLYDIPLPERGKTVRFWCLGDALTLSMPRFVSFSHLFQFS